jgi:UDP-glucose 4-epimerase
MRLLVVGGTGFVGGRLVGLSVERDIPVAVVAPAPGASPPGVAFFAGDGVVSALETFRPTVIVWAAGHNPVGDGLARAAEADLARSVGVNAGEFAALLVSAARLGITRIVQCGSTVVYGPASDYSDERVDETARPAPRGAYGLTKLMAESAAEWGNRALGLDAVTLRLPLVAGPGRWYGGAIAAMHRMIEAAASGGATRETVPGAAFDMVHGDDAAEVLLRLAQGAGGPSLLNLAGFTTRYREVAETLCRLAPSVRIAIDELAGPSAFPLVDDRRLREHLNWRPARDLSELLEGAMREARARRKAL